MKTAASSSPCAQLTSHSSKRQKNEENLRRIPTQLSLILFIGHHFSLCFSAHSLVSLPRVLKDRRLKRRKLNYIFITLIKKYICIHKKNVGN